MLRSTVLLILCLELTASTALAQGFVESPLITIFAIVAAIAIVIFLTVSKKWALWCGVIVWCIGLVVNVPILPMYLTGSAFVLPIAFLLRWLITSRDSKKVQRPKKPLRKKRNGRRFRLRFQIGYDSPPSDVKASPEPEETSVPEELTSPEIPPDTEGYSKSYGEITSYEQWLEREREEQKRITNSRLAMICVIGLFIGVLTSVSAQTDTQVVVLSGDRKDPLAACLLSAVVPGAGQFYNNDLFGAAVYLGGYALPLVMVYQDEREDLHFIDLFRPSFDTDHTTLLFISVFVVRVASAIEAAVSAGDINARQSSKFSLAPITAPNKLGALVSLRF